MLSFDGVRFRCTNRSKPDHYTILRSIRIKLGLSRPHLVSLRGAVEFVVLDALGSNRQMSDLSFQRLFFFPKALDIFQLQPQPLLYHFF